MRISTVLLALYLSAPVVAKEFTRRPNVFSSSKNLFARSADLKQRSRRLPSALAVRGGFAPPANFVTVFTEKVAPTLGTGIANAMFVSGIPAVQKARAAGTLGELNPVPFAMVLANCMAWVSYGCITQNPYAYWANAPGILLGMYMVMTGMQLGDSVARKQMEKLVLALGAVLVIAGHFSTLVLKTTEQRRVLFGYVANGLLLLYYASPLTTMSQVIKKKSSASLNWPVSMMNVVNGTLWLFYGLAIKDLFISIPNTIGAVLGLLQLSLVAIFPSKKEATN